MGMKKLYKTVFASECKNIDKIIVSGGRVGLQIETKPMDLINTVGGIIEDVTL